MKFTCDSCNAQYMISDDKVGPAGVKVRCKKCGHVILVRRVAEPAEGRDTSPAVSAPAAGPSPSANGATAPGTAPQEGAPSGSKPALTPSGGLDAELGNAFDHAFGDTPPETPAPDAGADLGATQAMGADDAAKVFAQTSPPATEWYVAIGQAQVGPLPLGEVKKKWEAGDVGPDSLVWRPGMGDWAPLTTVAELAGFLAPVPRAAAPSSRGGARPAAEAHRPEPQPEPQAEVSWKPVGASALAALASEEIASRAPEARPAPRAVPAKSLVDALPDGGGVDPTGALPLNIKALESTTGEKKIERRSSVARGAEKVRHRRSATRALVVGLVVVLLLAGGGVFAADRLGFLSLSSLLGGRAPQKTAAIPLPPPPVLPQATAPAAQPPAVAAQPPAAVQPPAAAPVQPAPAASAPKPEPKPERQATAPRPARTEPTPPPPREPAKREPQRVAAAPPPPPAPEPKPAKKGGDILDFDSTGDSALDDALGGGGSPAGKRSVYVPPARSGGGTLPDKVSAGEINGAVAQRMDALRKCVSDQKAREPDASGTLKMRWMIQADGSVRDVKCITPEYAQGQFAACIGGVVRGIRFPRSTTTGQEVTFPFNF